MLCTRDVRNAHPFPRHPQLPFWLGSPSSLSPSLSSLFLPRFNSIHPPPSLSAPPSSTTSSSLPPKNKSHTPTFHPRQPTRSRLPSASPSAFSDRPSSLSSSASALYPFRISNCSQTDWLGLKVVTFLPVVPHKTQTPHFLALAEKRSSVRSLLSIALLLSQPLNHPSPLSPSPHSNN